VIAAKQATAVIPIVFTTAGDPVATGLVAILSRPGGNVTGLSNQLPDAAGKRVQFLREIVPNFRSLTRSGRGGRRFKSCHSDHHFNRIEQLQLVRRNEMRNEMCILMRYGSSALPL
jgi:hypothetical protein